MGSDLAVKVSPLSSMRCWAIELNVEGRVSEIPALPAADWWPVLAEQDLSRVLDLIESDELDDAMLSGEVSGETLSEALTAAVEEVAGRSLHVAFVLAAVAEMQWPIRWRSTVKARFPLGRDATRGGLGRDLPDRVRGAGREGPGAVRGAAGQRIADLRQEVREGPAGGDGGLQRSGRSASLGRRAIHRRAVR
jgi:hypothetical protein